MEIPQIFTDSGYAFLSRWTHFLAGITWIGLLYYFNFVQVPSVAQMGDSSRSDITRNLVPRALWWFRWAALLTFISGLGILLFQGVLFLDPADSFSWVGRETADYFAAPVGIGILAGAILGTTMLLNVWFVIWPAQQVVIGSAETVAGGGDADPAAAPAGRRALLASRANTLFSIPLLFFMGAATHLTTSSHFDFDLSAGPQVAWWIIFFAVAGVVELSALEQLLRGSETPQTKWPFESIRNVIISGFVLAAILYFAFELLFQA